MRTTTENFASRCQQRYGRTVTSLSQPTFQMSNSAKGNSANALINSKETHTQGKWQMATQQMH